MTDWYSAPTPRSSPQTPAAQQPVPYSSLTNDQKARIAAETGTRPPPGYFGEYKLANWLWRLGSWFIDYTLVINIPGFIGTGLFKSSGVAMFLIAVMAVIDLGFVAMNPKSQTIGKMLLGLQVVRPIFNEGGWALAHPGNARVIGRQILHVFDLVVMIGFLRPLWSPMRQTYADSLTHTIVLRRPIEALVLAPRGSQNLLS